jgi:hypothetical protein
MVVSIERTPMSGTLLITVMGVTTALRGRNDHGHRPAPRKPRKKVVVEFFSGIANNLIASALFAVAGFAAGRLYEHLRRRRALGHVLALLGKNSKPKVIVVFPADAASNGPTTEPTNVLRMSLPEGAAIARIGQVCREAKNATDMQLVHPTALRDSGRPFVAVGGPGFCEWSRNWVEQAFPGLRYSPDRRCVEYDGAHWETTVQSATVKTDFGFMILGRTEKGTPFVLIWGASELGTNIAARAYSNLRSQLSRERYRAVVAGESWLFVARGDIEGYGVRTTDVSNVLVVASYPGPSSRTRSATVRS